MIQLYFTGLHCDEDTNEFDSDEPYVLVTTVDLGSVIQVQGFPIPIPGYDVFRFGPFDDVDKGEFRAGPGPSQAFWSRTGAPATLVDPDKAIFAVALMENDDGTRRRYAASSRAWSADRCSAVWTSPAKRRS